MPPARDRQRVLRARHHRRVTTHDADAAVSCLAERAARGPEHTCTGNQFAGPRRTERQAKKRSRFRRRAARSHGMAPVRVPSCRRAMRTQLAAVGKTRRRGCRLAAGSRGETGTWTAEEHAIESSTNRHARSTGPSRAVEVAVGSGPGVSPQRGTSTLARRDLRFFAVASWHAGWPYGRGRYEVSCDVTRSIPVAAFAAGC